MVVGGEQAVAHLLGRKDDSPVNSQKFSIHWVCVKVGPYTSCNLHGHPCRVQLVYGARGSSVIRITAPSCSDECPRSIETADYAPLESAFRSLETAVLRTWESHAKAHGCSAPT
jgi:hypothetical protein